jgi:hypothetical protein
MKTLLKVTTEEGSTVISKSSRGNKVKVKMKGNKTKSKGKKGVNIIKNNTVIAIGENSGVLISTGSGSINITYN